MALRAIGAGVRLARHRLERLARARAITSA
jgi:hypothetical protein